MKKMNHIDRRIDTPIVRFEDFYAEISNDWQGKAARLQARRWRALKRGDD